MKIENNVITLTDTLLLVVHIFGTLEIQVHTPDNDNGPYAR